MVVYLSIKEQDEADKAKLEAQVAALNSSLSEYQITAEKSGKVHLSNEIASGTVKGKVISIDQDANIDSQKGTIYFNMKVKPEETYLADKKGKKVNLALGMVTETRVKYDKITYLKYFLEQIGFKVD
jgi:multidrug efflux pump subunit AcrA (membrane-fusion protein)